MKTLVLFNKEQDSRGIEFIGGRKNRLILCALSLIIPIVFVCFLTNYYGTHSHGESTRSGTTQIQQNGNSEISNVSDVSESTSEGVSYPVGWLATDSYGVAVGENVWIVYSPDFDCTARNENGNIINDAAVIEAGYQYIVDAVNAAEASNSSSVIIAYNGSTIEVDANSVLVNAPDVLTTAVYDIAYSYNAPSNAGGISIPNLTGERVEGYRDGLIYRNYAGSSGYVAPVAYSTLLKLIKAESTLEANGYKLLIWDSYRPMTASKAIASAVSNAIQNVDGFEEALGGWASSWYASSGTSGHNFGTDVDVSVVDINGETVDMPSGFDSFDTSGHLTNAQLASSAITTRSYTDAVNSSAGCLALHAAMTEAGFSELASEWWHFADDEGEEAVSAITGGLGLDFTADISTSM